MRDLLNIRFRPAAWLMLGFVWSCATTPEIYQPEGSIIDAGSYTIKVPSGKSWKVSADAQQGTVTLADDARPAVIEVFRRTVEESKWAFGEEQVASDFRDRLEAMLRDEAAKRKYDLKSVNKDMATVKGRNYYTMSHMKWWGGWLLGTATEEDELFLYFPPDYEQSKLFYGFLLKTYRPSSIVTSFFKLHLHRDLVYEIMDSFQTK